jgi:catechol 2,3-dioxygenase
MTQTMRDSPPLPQETSLGPVTLAVTDAERSARFYRDFLGLQALNTEASRITLGVDGTALLVLEADPALRPRPWRATGLYHVAILLPTRAELAQILTRLVDARYQFGAADHLVSEALYLDDPDGNGLEIYRDRPRSEWRWRGDRVEMDTLPLDADGIMGALQGAPEPWQGMPPGTRIGHIHLRVADVAMAEAFYHGVLGFDVTTHYTGAVFLSAGGYHHHIGANIWESAGGSPPPPNTIGLRSFVILLPDAAALSRVRDQITAAGVGVRTQDGVLAVDDPWRNTALLAARG